MNPKPIIVRLLMEQKLEAQHIQASAQKVRQDTWTAYLVHTRLHAGIEALICEALLENQMNKTVLKGYM